MFNPMNFDGYAMVGAWGTSHWLMFAFVVVIVVYPVGLILRRLGYSPLWSALVLVPVVNLVGLWFVALQGTDRAFSSEVDAGSREENATRQKNRA